MGFKKYLSAPLTVLKDRVTMEIEAKATLIHHLVTSDFPHSGDVCRTVPSSPLNWDLEDKFQCLRRKVTKADGVCFSLITDRT